MSNFISKDKVDDYKLPLVKMVDVIQDLKEKQKDTPDRIYPLNELLKRLNVEMDSHEKVLIDEILKELRWKR
jgi:hypothetical protein